LATSPIGKVLAIPPINLLSLMAVDAVTVQVFI